MKKVAAISRLLQEEDNMVGKIVGYTVFIIHSSYFCSFIPTTQLLLQQCMNEFCTTVNDYKKSMT